MCGGGKQGGMEGRSGGKEGVGGARGAQEEGRNRVGERTVEACYLVNCVNTEASYSITSLDGWFNEWFNKGVCWS